MIDRAVIVLLGALIPVAEAMGSTAPPTRSPRSLLDGVAPGHAVAGLALNPVITMTLSDVMKKGGDGDVPIATGTALRQSASPTRC